MNNIRYAAIGAIIGRSGCAYPSVGCHMVSGVTGVIYGSIRSSISSDALTLSSTMSVSSSETSTSSNGLLHVMRGFVQSVYLPCVSLLPFVLFFVI